MNIIWRIRISKKITIYLIVFIAIDADGRLIMNFTYGRQFADILKYRNMNITSHYIKSIYI